MTLLPDTSGYDLIAIGSGPAGQCAAIQAAKLGKRVAVVERERVLGGRSVNGGTLPSKTLRAAIVELTGLYGGPPRLRRELTIDDLLWRAQDVIEHERDSIHHDLRRHGVDVLVGVGSFVDPRTLEIRSSQASRRVRSERFVIAVGTRPSRPPGFDFDERTVIDGDGILGLSRIPETLVIVGGGVVGLEYASMAAALGVGVTLVEAQHRVLDFVDNELAEALRYHLCGLGVVFRLGDAVKAVERDRTGASVHLAGGSCLRAEAVLHAGTRRGATDELNLGAAGVLADDRGRIPVDREYRTACAHIFAAGAVVGFPGLASTSREQGRHAALTALGETAESRTHSPYGIYTIPEIAFVGVNERELLGTGVPYVVGIGRYRQLTNGQIEGDRTGRLKVLVHAESRRVLGVHVFGTAAAELVHLGQAVMAGGLPIDYLAEAVFNVPTFTEAYSLAAAAAVKELGAFEPARTRSAA